MLTVVSTKRTLPSPSGSPVLCNYVPFTTETEYDLKGQTPCTQGLVSLRKHRICHRRSRWRARCSAHPQAGPGRCSGTHDARLPSKLRPGPSLRRPQGRHLTAHPPGRTPAAPRVTSDLGPRRPSPRPLCPPHPKPGPT